MATPRFLSKFAPFPRPFWTINGVELFERGAYYGMLSVLALFIARDLQFPAWLTGILLAIQFPLLYFVPVVSGAIADKLGFKKLLLVTFAVLIAGYVVLATATTFWTGLLGIVLYGLGAGLFKPMPAATVSDTTSEQDRNFGFAIYYWMINLGAFVAPIGMQLAFGGSYRPYFLVSAALSALNLVICLTVWKDIRTPKPDISVGQSLTSIGQIAKHPAFAVLLVIYCGFWFMYAITTSFLQIYAVDQGILTEANIALLVPANALAILLVGPVLSKLTGKAPSLLLMIVGITIFCSGFLIIGFVPFLWAVLAGILVYSIGEFLTHPSYLAYVTKISPAERVPLFLGFGFLPIGVGQFLGTLSGGFLYQRFAVDSGSPQMFWVSIVAVGLLTVAALVVYNLVLTRRQTPVTDERPRRGPAGAMVAALVALMLIPALVVAATMAPTSPITPAGAGGDDAVDGLVDLDVADVTGQTSQGETTEEKVAVPDGATGTLTFTLAWTDEAPAAASTNKPDSFKLHVTAPNGTMVAMTDATPNAANGDGEIVVEVPAAAGEWTLGVELVDAGDQSRQVGPLELPGPTGTADNGNAWTLTTGAKGSG